MCGYGMAVYFRPGGGSNGNAASIVGATDLVLSAATSGLRLFSIAGQQGTVQASDPAQGLADAGLAVRSAVGRLASGGLEALTLNGRPVLVAYGAGTSTTGYWLDTGQPLTQGFSLGTGNLTLLSLDALPLDGGGNLVLATSLQEPGISVWRRAADGTMTRQESLSAGTGMAGYDLLDLATVQMPTGRFVLATSALSHEVTVWRIDGAGTAELADVLSARDGLAVATPSRLIPITVDGRHFVLIAASGSGSIVVAELGADGRMTILDQVNDDMTTRFQGISVLNAITLNGRTYVVAGGADDGLTLMALLPNGRLVHLETIASTPALRIENPTALELGLSNGGIDVWFTSGTTAGITRLRIDQGIPAPPRHAGAGGGTVSGDARDDLLIGGDGPDTLIGGAGRDILVDGRGADRLTGGPGADIFVLIPDGELDIITDFEVGIDVLDLSAFGIYGPADVTFIARSDGMGIRIGTESLRVLSADGNPIPASAFTSANMLGLWHVPVIVPDTTARLMQATEGNDSLVGRDGNDTLAGDGKATVLIGGLGDDLLVGGRIDSGWDPEAASIYRLYLATLGRSPDRPGHFAWTTQLADDQASLHTIARQFLGSVEFGNLYGNTTNTTFVTLLYHNVLGRAPDAAGLAGWVGQLQAGRDRASVVLGFSESAEFVRATEAAALGYSRSAYQMSWADEVYRLYQATLGRAPDPAGLQGWTAALAEGGVLRAIVPGFINSTEFRNLYGNTSDTAFVTLLYQNVLGRAPDPAGLAGWLARMQAGLDRAGVVLGFAESVEFVRGTFEGLGHWMRTVASGTRLVGGAGNDTLVGGLGADVFVFDPADGPGTDRVVGLEPWDWIDLSAFGYGTTDEALGYFRQHGGSVRFVDQDVTIVFEGIHLTQISHDMLLI